MEDTAKNQHHAFESHPHKTLFTLAIPVLFSLVAEPVTGLVDTAFISRLGAQPMAALGIGTMVFSSVFWIFGFLGIGTQTEVSHSLGKGDEVRASSLCWLAVGLGLVLGFLLIAVLYPMLGIIAEGMGGTGDVLQYAQEYMRYRLLGAPAILVTLSCFGALRGYQEMQTPLWIAVGLNAVNICLDWLLVFGHGPFPEMGVAGASLASSISQWFGAAGALIIIKRRFGLNLNFGIKDIRRLFVIGGDLFIRTGSVCVFLLFCTRVATRAGADAGAAHQAIRQFFVFLALFLDSFAISGQSLVGYFIGCSDIFHARKVASLVCFWSFITGIFLMIAMILGENTVIWILVPKEAVKVFIPAWLAVSLLQPINSLSFATDGIHLGTGDFSYLRNSMFTAVLISVAAIFLVERLEPENMLLWIWIISGIWTSLRALFGMIRIWPGIGRAPLKSENQPTVATN
ncbi:MATE family efflux transporter [Maridesulfovibrio bastinii]|uniref:MATE family efflux transporter n=1 Tax=Maridesulfovibrio bastinii TaxID=47157 RepID=UPI000550C1CD|nr:MATE family efflux transporter [Maridesulfovibrio bastinii]